MESDDIKPPSDYDSSGSDASDLIPGDSSNFEIRSPPRKNAVQKAPADLKKSSPSVAIPHRPRGGSVWAAQGLVAPTIVQPKTTNTNISAVEKRHRDLYEFEQALQYRSIMSSATRFHTSTPEDRALSHSERLHLGAMIESYLHSNGLYRTMRELHRVFPSLKDTGSGGVSGKDATESQLDTVLMVCEEVRRTNMLFDDETPWKADRLALLSVPLVNLDLNSQAFGGTVEVLFEKLIFEEKDVPYPHASGGSKPEFNFTNVFLIMSPLFVCPQVLLSLNMKLFKTLLSSRGTHRLPESRVSELLLRVIVILDSYTRINAADFTRTAIERLTSFSVGAALSLQKKPAELSVAIGNLQASIEHVSRHGSFTAWNRIGALKAHPQNFASVPTSTLNPHVRIDSILDINDAELSRQICLLSFSLFERVHLREFFHNAWTETPSLLRTLSSNLTAIVNFSSRFQLWVSSQVVSPLDLETRRTTYRKFVRICRALYNGQNFEMVNSILEGLHHPAVQRMKRTISGLDAKEREELEGLIKVMDPFDNTLQDISYHITSPSIPTIGPILGAFYRAEDSAKTTLFHEETQTHLVNWSKIVQLAKPAFRWVSFQSVPYEFYVLPTVQRFLWQMPGRVSNPELLMELSLEREPL